MTNQDASPMIRERVVHPVLYPAREAPLAANYVHLKPHLSFGQQPKLLRGLYSILLTSIVMTVFEIVFFYVIINPTTTDAVQDMLGGLSGIFGGLDPPLPQPAKNSFAALLKTNAHNETLLINQTNQYALITVSLFAVFLVVGLLLLNLRMNRLGHNLDRVVYFGIDFNATVLTSVLTVACLMLFQITFYFFGTEFAFEGTKGTEELTHAFNNQLRRDLGLTPVAPL